MIGGNMYSFFDSTVEIDQDNSAVTIVYKGNHAALIIEHLRPDFPEREVIYTHFLPRDIQRPDSSLEGICLTLKQIESKPRQGWVELRVVHADTLESLKTRVRMTHETTTYVISDTEIKNAFLRNIRAEADGRVAVPNFQILGGPANNGNALNCRSWVREKLRLAGHDIPVSFVDKNCSDTLNSDDYYSRCLIL